MQVRSMLGGRTLFGLVNNAGVAFHAPLMYQPIAEFRRNVDVNLVGTLIVTQVRLTAHCTCAQYPCCKGRSGFVQVMLGRICGPVSMAWPAGFFAAPGSGQEPGRRPGAHRHDILHRRQVCGALYRGLCSLQART